MVVYIDCFFANKFRRRGGGDTDGMRFYRHGVEASDTLLPRRVHRGSFRGAALISAGGVEVLSGSAAAILKRPLDPLRVCHLRCLRGGEYAVCSGMLLPPQGFPDPHIPVLCTDVACSPSVSRIASTPSRREICSLPRPTSSLSSPRQHEHPTTQQRHC